MKIAKLRGLRIGHFINQFEGATLEKRHMFRIIVSRWLASSASQDVVSNTPASYQSNIRLIIPNINPESR